MGNGAFIALSAKSALSLNDCTATHSAASLSSMASTSNCDILSYRLHGFTSMSRRQRPVAMSSTSPSVGMHSSVGVPARGVKTRYRE